MRYEFNGEPYPAHVADKSFHGVVYSVVTGTEDEVRATTAVYTERFPIEVYDTTAVGNAQYLGAMTSEGLDIYQLIILRREHGG